MCGGSCKCAGTCARSASTPAAPPVGPLPPSKRGVETCLLAHQERYGIYGFNDGPDSDERDDWRLDDVPRWELLAQVAWALDRYRTVLINKD